MKPMTNAADERQVKGAKIKEKNQRLQELDDVKNILSSQVGRRFFWRYLGECGVFQSSFTGSSETFFREGSRNIGLKLLADLNDADPSVYSVMLKENTKGEKNE